jgi:hypothetical protein
MFEIQDNTIQITKEDGTTESGASTFITTTTPGKRITI